jgi:hypothetical protein
MPRIIRSFTLYHSLKFSFPRFVFLMRRSARLLEMFALPDLGSVSFVHITGQRIMPCGPAMGRGKTSLLDEP